MTEKFDQNKYVSDFKKETYYTARALFPKADEEKIKSAAKDYGLSVSSFIVMCVEDMISRSKDMTEDIFERYKDWIIADELWEGSRPHEWRLIRIKDIYYIAPKNAFIVKEFPVSITLNTNMLRKTDIRPNESEEFIKMHSELDFFTAGLYPRNPIPLCNRAVTEAEYEWLKKYLCIADDQIGGQVEDTYTSLYKNRSEDVVYQELDLTPEQLDKLSKANFYKETAIIDSFTGTQIRIK